MKLTSGGIESAALPIYDDRGVEEEKSRAETAKAGRRNKGSVTEGEEATALSRLLERAVDSIAELLRGVEIGSLTKF